MSEIRRGNERVRVGLDTGDETRTQQHAEAACNVNNIVDTYMRTGVWQHVTDREPMYGDFSAFNDLQTAMVLVRNTEAEFEKLPAVVRKAAENDPARFFEMLATPEGCFALQEAGLPFTETIPDPSPPPVREAPAVEPSVPVETPVADPAAS